MTVVTGDIRLVTNKPDSVSQVWLRAPKGRVQGTAYVTESPDTVQVTGGAVSFTALPGPLVMVLVTQGQPLNSVKLIVPDKLNATLRECIETVGLVDDGTLSALEELALEVSSIAGQIASADQLERWATETVQAAQGIEQAASSAESSASRAAASESSAKTSEINAANSATAASNIRDFVMKSGYPLSGALGVLKARLMAKDIAPIVLVFAGSSTTEGSNVPLANRWVTKIAEKATHEQVISSYEDAVSVAPFHDGITVINMGRSGYNSGTYIRSEEAPVVGSWSPTLVMHAAGANDARTSWGTPAVVARGISSRIDAIDAASPLPVAHIVMHQHERYDGTLLAPWRDYWESLVGIATTRPNVTVLNAADVFKALGVPGSDPLGLMASDKIHVNTKGHAVYAEMIGDVLNLPEKVDRTTILFDDFNRPDNTDIAGDSPTIGRSGSVWGSLTSPKIYIKNNRAAATFGTAATALIDTGVADGDITVDFDFLTPGSSVAGVVFRATDINNRWGVYIGGADNEVELYRMVDGVNTVMSGATVGGAKYSKTGMATMRIRVKGQSINAWIDGVKVIEHTMTEAENAMSRTWSKVGFRVSGSVTEFDNLRVTSV